jgi:hypothetical protein
VLEGRGTGKKGAGEAIAMNGVVKKTTELSLSEQAGIFALFNTVLRKTKQRSIFTISFLIRF